MERQEIISKFNELRKAYLIRYGTAVEIRGCRVYSYDFDDDGARIWIDHKRSKVTWDELTENEVRGLEEIVKRYYPAQMEITRPEKHLLTFTNGAGESMTADMKNQKFIKRYSNGRERIVSYPHTFFRRYHARLLFNRIPTDAFFKKFLDYTVHRNGQCRNVGTFLVRMFDKWHLESYMAVGRPFDHSTTHPYNFFDRDVRQKLDAENIRYDANICTFFASNEDLGRAVFGYIKDLPNFKAIFNLICKEMNHYNTLIEHYNYDGKRVFEYCQERNWSNKAGVKTPDDNATWRTWDYNLVQFLCDYARMAHAVFGTDFVRYPKNIKEAHDEVTVLYNERKREFDEQAFADLIDTKLEWEKDEFAIVHPKTTQEIIEEGKALGHCVGSYVDSVINGVTKILFLREKSNLSKPFVTLEIRNGRIAQGRGRSNSRPPYDANEFLTLWAKKMKITR